MAAVRESALLDVMEGAEHAHRADRVDAAASAIRARAGLRGDLRHPCGPRLAAAGIRHADRGGGPAQFRSSGFRFRHQRRP